jgi:hypothetical protein
MAALLAEFETYLSRDGADPVADLVGIRQHALWPNSALGRMSPILHTDG